MPRATCERRIGLGRRLAELVVEEAVPEPGEGAPLVAEDVHGHGPPAVEGADDAVAGDVDVVRGISRQILWLAKQARLDLSKQP